MISSYLLSMGISSSLYKQYQENFKAMTLTEREVVNTQIMDLLMIERKVDYKNEKRDIKLTIFCPKDKTFESCLTPTNIKLTETKAKSFEDLLGEIDLAIVEHLKKKDRV